MKSIVSATLPWMLFLAAGGAAGCGTDSCATGQVAACACLGGESGLQECRADGTFDRCLCGDELADSGLRADAGTPPDTPSECEWDVSSLTVWGGLLQLEGGDMGIIVPRSGGTEPTVWRIPCDGSPPFEVSVAVGTAVRRMPDGSYYIGEPRSGARLAGGGAYLNPDLSLTPMPLHESGHAGRIPDDRRHVFEREFDPTGAEQCVVDYDSSGREVGRVCPPANATLMAPLERGIVYGVNADAGIDLECWSGGSASPARVPVPAGTGLDALGPPVVLPARGDRFFVFMDLGGESVIRSLDCDGNLHWSIGASGGASSTLQALQGARWTGDGDLLFFFNSPFGGSWNMEGTSGRHLVGRFSSETGEPRWIRSLGEQFFAGPGPNDTIWVNGLDVGITVLDGDGEYLLGNPLP